MARVIEAKLDARDVRIGIVVSRFNMVVTEKLLQGALDALKRYGGRDENIDILRVPGCFEIPFFASKMAFSGKYDALICLGAVIRGETAHFEHIASEVTRGIGSVTRASKIPIAFGVLTTYNMEQALQRAGSEMENKGFEAALVAIEMANLNRTVL